MLLSLPDVSPIAVATFRRSAVLVAFLFMLPAAPLGAADMSSVMTLPKPLTNGTPWTADEIKRLHDDLDAALIAAPGLQGAHIGILVVETGTGRVLYEHDANADFVPASTLKVFTGSTALAKLGPTFRFRTTLVASVAPSGGVIDGDLIVRGGGDPLFSEGDVQAAATAVASQGIKVVRGALVVDSSYFDDEPWHESWEWVDLGQAFGAPVGAFNLDFNSVVVTVTPAAAVGGSPLVDTVPPPPGYQIQNDATTGPIGSPSTIDVARGRSGTLEIVGSIPLGSDPVGLRAAVNDPSAFAGGALVRALNAQGVTVGNGAVTGTAPPSSVVLWQHDSLPLAQLLADFWYPSNNLIGESLLKALGVANGGPPGTRAKGIALENAFLRSAGIEPKTVEIYDGSGLSRYNAVTPRALVKMLQYDWHAPWRDDVLNALPVAGVRGDIASSYVGTPAQGRLFAKTGSMTHVTNITGYMQTARHGAVTFAFLLDDALGDDDAIAARRAEFFSRLYND